MNLHRFFAGCTAAALLAVCATLSSRDASAFQLAPPAAADAGGVEVLTRAPVHEAFAEVVAFDPEPGLVAPKAPPADIEEVPPEQRPEGVNVAWISGYWAWDEERNDFLWISGIWRSIPPGRQWQPGYWARSGTGVQWSSGYWADAQETEVDYLPEPPATVEVGPNVAAPSADHRWLPGVWLWQMNRYAWRPGIWAAGQSDWDWVPAHYVWTPRGYVFVDGYYDHSVARRGVLYAPVYFNSGVYAQRGFTYTPSVAINTAIFGSHLFLRPSYGHYYYGDYYGTNYSNAGYSPWFTFNTSRRGYDPFYARQSWTNRQDRGWQQTVQTNYNHFRDNEGSRPPRTWADQRARQAGPATPNRQDFTVAASLAELTKSKEYSLRLQAIDKTERQQFAQREQAIRQLRAERQKLEFQAADSPSVEPKTPRTVPGPRVKRPASPIVAQPDDRIGRDAPPKRYEYPQPDLKIEPMPRKVGRIPTVPAEPKRVIVPKPELPKVEPKGPPSVEPKGPPSREPKGPPSVEPKGPPSRGPQTPDAGGPKGPDAGGPKGPAPAPNNPQAVPRGTPKGEKGNPKS